MLLLWIDGAHGWKKPSKLDTAYLLLANASKKDNLFDMSRQFK